MYMSLRLFRWLITWLLLRSTSYPQTRQKFDFLFVQYFRNISGSLFFAVRLTLSFDPSPQTFQTDQSTSGRKSRPRDRWTLASPLHVHSSFRLSSSSRDILPYHKAYTCLELHSLLLTLILMLEQDGINLDTASPENLRKQNHFCKLMDTSSPAERWP